MSEDTLGDRIRSEASLASRTGQFDRLMWIAAEVDDLEVKIRLDERERLAKQWSEDSHGVRFNHAHDDLTPHQRVLKWIRGIT